MSFPNFTSRRFGFRQIQAPVSDGDRVYPLGGRARTSSGSCESCHASTSHAAALAGVPGASLGWAAICSVPRSQGCRSSADAYVGPHFGRFVCSWIIARNPAHYVDRASGRLIRGAFFCAGLRLQR
jgi:hypothetical protein